jgi:hypothetical protein
VVALKEKEKFIVSHELVNFSLIIKIIKNNKEKIVLTNRSVIQIYKK